MRAERVAGVAASGDRVAFLYERAFSHQILRKVHVHGHEADAVIDDDRVAVVLEAPGESHSTPVHGIHGRTDSGAEVGAVVA